MSNSFEFTRLQNIFIKFVSKNIKSDKVRADSKSNTRPKIDRNFFVEIFRLSGCSMTSFDILNSMIVTRLGENLEVKCLNLKNFQKKSTTFRR